MNKYFIGSVVVIILLILGATFLTQRKKESTVTIGSKKFSVELARTNTEQAKGLSGRTNLDDNRGMLFIFSESDVYSFWMKDTLIPLDMIWINDDRIVDIQTLYPPVGNTVPQYKPTQEANYVLEINAGLSKKYGFKIGDEVKMNY